MKPLPVAAFALLAACGAQPTTPLEIQEEVQAPAASLMMGGWRYARPTPASGEPSLNAGLLVEFEIDSIAARQFYGRVSFWFAGDVGVPLEAFGRVTGHIDEASRVSLVIPRTDPSVPAIRLGAEVSGDRLVVQGSWRGDEAGPFPAGSAFVRTATGT